MRIRSRPTKSHRPLSIHNVDNLPPSLFDPRHRQGPVVHSPKPFPRDAHPAARLFRREALQHFRQIRAWWPLHRQCIIIIMIRVPLHQARWKRFAIFVMRDGEPHPRPYFPQPLETGFDGRMQSIDVAFDDRRSCGVERRVQYSFQRLASSMVLGVALVQRSVGVKVDFSVRRVGDDDAADLSAVRVADGF